MSIHTFLPVESVVSVRKSGQKFMAGGQAPGSLVLAPDAVNQRNPKKIAAIVAPKKYMAAAVSRPDEKK